LLNPINQSIDTIEETEFSYEAIARSVRYTLATNYLLLFYNFFLTLNDCYHLKVLQYLQISDNIY